MKKIRVKIFLLIALGLLAGLFVYLSLYEEPEQSKPSNIRGFVLSSIEEHGIEKAYSVVKGELEGDYARGHTYLHIFGEEIYNKLGVVGISICDDSYGYGCYHGFLTRGFADKGLDFVNQAEEICLDKSRVESSTGCEHGIGHGLIEYLGHDEIVQALDICSTLSWKEKLFGCQDGVFMEYNFTTKVGGDNFSSNIREIKKEAPYAICDTIPSNFLEACYYSLPQLWLAAFGHDYVMLGGMCRNIAEGQYRRACYYGLGTNIPVGVGFDTDSAVEACKMMPDNEGEIGCRIFAARSFFPLKEYKDSYKDVCTQDAEENVSFECLNSFRK